VTSVETSPLGPSAVGPSTSAPTGPWLVLATEGSAAALGTSAAALGTSAAVPVTRVASGATFIRLLSELAPRLAILAMPPAGATELLAAVAERHHRPTLQLVLVNDPSDVTGRLRALSLGFDEALPASIAPEELIGRALLLVDASRSRPAASLQVTIAPGVHLDVAGRRVRRGEIDVHLRPREYALLAVLATHPGRVFSRRELVDRAWGAGYTGGARTVDVHVRWLRAKLEPDPARPVHLVTVRGSGYRLDPPNG